MIAVSFLIGKQLLHREPQSRDRRDIFRAGTKRPLLTAAVKHRQDMRLFVDIQKSAAFRSMQLVSAHRQQIDTDTPRIDQHFPIRLHRVHMKQCFRRTLMDDLRDLLHRFDRTDLIVHMHDRNQNRIAAQHRPQLFRRHHAVFVHRQIAYLKAFFFECRHRIVHRRVFDHRRHNMPALPLLCARCPENRQIVAFRAARGKNNLFFLCL